MEVTKRCATLPLAFAGTIKALGERQVTTETLAQGFPSPLPSTHRSIIDLEEEPYVRSCWKDRT